MKLKQGKEAGYRDYVEKNGDSYGSGVIRFEERWAKLMEQAIASGEKLEDVADAMSHEADTEGITGFMFGCAVQGLAFFWEHGEALRRWHNLKVQIGDEGERANTDGGVLNPAVLIVG
jgi:hypothetical protein